MPIKVFKMAIHHVHHLSFSSLLNLQNSLIKEELDHNLDWRLLALFLVVQINIVNGLGCLSVPSSIILCVGDLFGIEISNNRPPDSGIETSKDRTHLEIQIQVHS